MLALTLCVALVGPGLITIEDTLANKRRQSQETSDIPQQTEARTSVEGQNHARHPSRDATRQRVILLSSFLFILLILVSCHWFVVCLSSVGHSFVTRGIIDVISPFSEQFCDGPVMVDLKPMSGRILGRRAYHSCTQLESAGRSADKCGRTEEKPQMPGGNADMTSTSRRLSHGEAERHGWTSRIAVVFPAFLRLGGVYFDDLISTLKPPAEPRVTSHFSVIRESPHPWRPVVKFCPPPAFVQGPEGLYRRFHWSVQSSLRPTLRTDQSMNRTFTPPSWRLMHSGLANGDARTDIVGMASHSGGKFRAVPVRYAPVRSGIEQYPASGSDPGHPPFARCAFQ